MQGPTLPPQHAMHVFSGLLEGSAAGDTVASEAGKASFGHHVSPSPLLVELRYQRCTKVSSPSSPAPSPATQCTYKTTNPQRCGGFWLILCLLLVQSPHALCCIQSQSGSFLRTYLHHSSPQLRAALWATLTQGRTSALTQPTVCFKQTYWSI